MRQSFKNWQQTLNSMVTDSDGSDDECSTPEPVAKPQKAIEIEENKSDFYAVKYSTIVY